MGRHFVDNPLTPETSGGPAPVADMGPFEVQLRTASRDSINRLLRRPGPSQAVFHTRPNRIDTIGPMNSKRT